MKSEALDHEPGGELLRSCVTLMAHRRRLYEDVMDYQTIESFSRAYAASADDLIRFASATVGPTDAPDVVSNTLIRLLEDGTLDDVVNKRAFLYRAVMWEAKSWKRSSWRRRRRDHAVARTEAVLMPEVAPEVLSAVRSLSPQQRAATYLTYWEDMSPSEIGATLGVGEGTVKKHLARARARLRSVLDA